MSANARSSKKRKTTESSATKVVAKPTRPSRPMRGIPDSLFVELVYADSKVLTSSAGVPTSNIYRLNSLFDPDYSGTGNQPVGFDNYALIYGRYVVYEANVECRIVNGNATAQMLVMRAKNNITSITTNDGVLAAICDKDNCVSAMTTAAYDVVTLKKNFKLYNITGETRASYLTDDSYQAAVSANPTETIGLEILGGQVGAAVSTVILAYVLRISFKVKFFDRVNQGLS